MTGPPIVLEDVSRSFGDKVIFSGVDLAVAEGRTTAIIGPSGSGKSVMLKLIVGLLPPSSGRVTCFGTDMATATQAQVYAVRARMGMLFQDGALFDSMTVGENVAFPLEHHRKGLTAAQRRDAVEEKLRLVGLPDMQERATPSLSGGQRKRVGLARAIIMEPEIVLFDEPNSGLDPVTSGAIDELIAEMKRELGITFVVITHDIVSAVQIADHIAMLHGGRLIASAPTDQFVRSPDPRVRAFLARNLRLPEGDGDVAGLPAPR